MDFNVLRKIGLTDGEIRVYKALINLGKSSTGGIMKKSGISSSKVYLILDKLIQKGLVSFIIENNVKKFQITNPQSIIGYLEKQKQELNAIEKDFEKVVPQINSMLGTYEEESAQVYKGMRGIRVAFENLLEELEKGEEYCFFGISKEEMSNKQVLNFFQNWHAKRIAKGVHVKGIADTTLRKLYSKTPIFKKMYAIKYYDLTLPTGLTIGKNRVNLLLWGEENICYEIISKRAAQRYREFFYKIWKEAKP